MKPVWQQSLPAIFFLLIAGIPTFSCAEDLNDATIRAIYAESSAAIRDMQKTRQLMEQRLADNFTLQSNLTQIVADNPPKTSTDTYNKSQSMEASMKGYSVMKIDTFQNNILNIKYSDDKKSAIVQDSTTSTGKLYVPGPNGTLTSAGYDDAEACTDMLTLVGTQIQFVQSACNERITVKQ